MITFLLALVILGSLPAFGAALIFIYRGWRGDERALRRGASLAGWITVGMCGVYLGLAFTAPAHPAASVEIFFNGLLISILILLRYHSVTPRLIAASFLIGMHGVWDGLHLLALPIATALVPSWYAVACAIFDLAYFGAVLPICFQMLRAASIPSPQKT